MKKIFKNLFFGIGGEVLIMAMGIILPRFILVSFGSEINGITATITQIFTYIALLEAGIGNASLNCLYKNIADADRGGICTTVSATRKYFRRLVPGYVFCVTLFLIVYPLVAETEVPAQTIRMIILIQGLTGVLNFFFTNTYIQLLIADGRSYITSNLMLMVKAVATALQILLIGLGFDIVSVQLSLLVANIIKAAIVYFYVRRVYPWLTKDPAADIKILAQRGALVVHEISGVIFQSTDVFIISVFCSLKEASVYTIYNLVFSNFSRVSTMLFQGIDFTLGAQYHSDLQKYTKLHDLYEMLLVCIVTTLLSAACMVILPFVRLYTAGVTDVNYIIPILPILFSLIQILSTGRTVASKLITISGGAKDTVANAITETAINLVTSIVLVNLIGMPGVLLGTIAALLYRTNDIILYANLKILKRKPWRAYKTMVVNLATFAVVTAVAYAFPMTITNYLEFFVKGVQALGITALVFVAVNYVTDTNMREFLLSVGKLIVQKISALVKK